MSKLIICRGLPGSGKTTWAKEYVRQQVAAGNTYIMNVDRDQFRQANGFTVVPGEYENTVTQIIDALMRKFLQKGFTVIESSTNLNSSTVKKWLKVARHFGSEVEIVDFDLPLEECIKRANERTIAGGHEVPEKVIRSMHTRYFNKGIFPDNPNMAVEYVNFELYVPDTTKPRTFLWDLDGTLAKHNRSPYDYASLHTDDPHKDVFNMLGDLGGLNYHNVFLSGRPAEYADQTINWIKKHSSFQPVLNKDLFMRPTNDKRADTVIKYQLFMESIAPHHNVVGVFDDRNTVVEMWRRIGLRCYHVADGDF